MNQEERAIATVIRCFFRMRESAAEPKLFGGFFHSEGSSIRDEYMANSKQPEAVVLFFAEMDKKLDALLNYMQRGHLEEQFPSQGVITSLNSHGAVFSCKEPLAPGDLLEVVFFLQEFPLQAFSVNCCVKDLQEDAFVLEFQSLSPEEREELIRFMFQEERRLIRQKKQQD